MRPPVLDWSVGEHQAFPRPGPAAGTDPRWRISGRSVVRRVDALGFPIGPPVRLPSRVGDIAVCDRSLFVTYGSGWIAKFTADGRRVARYHYKLGNAPSPLLCGPRSIFIVLPTHGTIVALSRSRLRFQSRLAVGLTTTEPVLIDDHLYAADRDNNQVMSFDASALTLEDRYDVEDGPVELTSTNRGLVIRYASGLIGLMSLAGITNRLGWIHAGGRLHMAGSGPLVAIAGSDSPRVDIFDTSRGVHGFLMAKPSTGITAIDVTPGTGDLELATRRDDQVIRLSAATLMSAVRAPRRSGGRSP
jgi:hypothetical protein